MVQPARLRMRTLKEKKRNFTITVLLGRIYNRGWMWNEIDFTDIESYHIFRDHGPNDHMRTHDLLLFIITLLLLTMIEINCWISLNGHNYLFLHSKKNCISGSVNTHMLLQLITIMLRYFHWTQLKKKKIVSKHISEEEKKLGTGYIN